MVTHRIEIYDGSIHPATRPYATLWASDEREARRIAAKALGRRTLRGASSWDRAQGGMVWQFGPRVEDNGYDFAVVIDIADEAREQAEEERDLARDDYDVCG